MFFFQIPGDIENKVKQRTEKFSSVQVPVQPFIVVEGSGAVVNKTYVCVFGELFPVLSVLKAIDICFKVYHVFHLGYQFQSEHMWIFIQHAMYNINTKWDTKIPYILDIVNKVKHIKSSE